MDEKRVHEPVEESRLESAVPEGLDLRLAGDGSALPTRPMVGYNRWSHVAVVCGATSPTPDGQDVVVRGAMNELYFRDADDLLAELEGQWADLYPDDMEPYIDEFGEVSCPDWL